MKETETYSHIYFIISNPYYKCFLLFRAHGVVNMSDINQAKRFILDYRL